MSARAPILPLCPYVHVYQSTVHTLREATSAHYPLGHSWQTHNKTKPAILHNDHTNGDDWQLHKCIKTGKHAGLEQCAQTLADAHKPTNAPLQGLHGVSLLDYICRLYVVTQEWLHTHTHKSSSAGRPPRVLVYQDRLCCSGLYGGLIKTRPYLIVRNSMHACCKHIQRE